jgi:hypothetical protein
MREPRDPLLKVVLIAFDRKRKENILHCIKFYVKTQALLQRRAHAVMHKRGEMDV